MVRINTALTYKLAIPNVAGVFSAVRLAGQAQIGGYGVQNGAMQHFEAQAGFDWGGFSFDGVLAWAKDAASLSTFNGGNLGQCGLTGPYAPWSIKVNNICYDSNDVVKATLSNIFGTQLTASYKWDRFKFYGGYIYARQSNPSDDFFSGFRTMYPGLIVPGGTYNFFTGANTSAVTSANAFNTNKVLQTVWTGVKWSVPDAWLHGWGALDLSAAFYYQTQNNYNFTFANGVTDSDGLHRLGRLHQQQQVRRQPGRHRVPGRLAAGHACRRLRRRHDHQCVRRTRQRIFQCDPGLQRQDDHHHASGAHAELRSDGRYPNPVLTTRGLRPPGRGVRPKRPAMRMRSG